MRVDVFPQRVQLSGATPVTFRVTVTNTADVISGHVVRVLGLDPAWVETDQEQLSLFPGTSGIVTVTVTPPANLPAGIHRFSLQVRELTEPQRTTITDVELEVPPAPTVQMRLDPSAVTAGKRGSFGLLVENNGNTTVSAPLTGLDEEEKIKYRFDPPSVELPPGEHAAIELRVKAHRKLLGNPTVRTFRVRLEDQSYELDNRPVSNGTLVQRAVVGRGSLGLLGLLAAITVFALVLTYAMSSLVGRSTADRNLALEVAQAQQNAGAVGSGSASGTVRLLTSGSPVRGVAVALFDASNTATPLTSTATDGTGAYHFGSLSAGTYKLRFSGAGFAQLWYPESLSDSGAQSITVQTGQDVNSLDVRLGGIPAQISGTVVPADADSGVDTTSEVTGAKVSLELPGTIQTTTASPTTSPTSGSTTPSGTSSATSSLPTAADAGTVLQTVPVGADGSYTLANVPSPSVYDLVVSKPGYATETQRVDVAGGEKRTGVEIPLVKGDGVIAGHVTGAKGPIGGATITATYGNTTVQTVSDKQGDVGAFILRDLPTPGTFSVVIAHAGYASQTQSLSLTQAQHLSGVSATLSQSAGQLSGLVTTLPDSEPAPGVTVTVTDGAQTIQTVTESKGVDGQPGVPGHWQLGGLSVPGTYTVTFTRSDLATQTTSISLNGFGVATSSTAAGAAASTSAVNAAMRFATATVYGVTSVKGGTGTSQSPQGEVTVTLTNGTTTYTVTSATIPEKGKFQIDNVAPGTYTATVSASGTQAISSILNLNAGDKTPFNPVLAAPAAIYGCVLYAGSTDPVQSAQLVLYRAADYPKVVVASTRTVSDGPSTCSNTSSESDDAKATGGYVFSDVNAPDDYVLELDYPAAGDAYSSRTIPVDLSQQVHADFSVTR